MSKDEIIYDTKFQQQCGKYGLNWENCEIYDEVILLNTQLQDLYLIFDKNYNTIAIDKFESDYSIESKSDFVKRKYYGYCNFTDILPFGENFGYPFENFTLKQIIDLSNRIEIMETNHGHSLSTKINGEWYNRQSKEHEDYFKLLSYIKFLGEEIKKYFLINYHLQVLGFEPPNIYEYIRKLINKVNNTINLCIEYDIRPWPTYIISSIGQDNRELNIDGILFDVVDLLLNDKGFKSKSGSIDEIEVFDKPNSKSSLSVLAMQLLKILDLSDEDLKKKEENIRKDSIEQQLSKVMPWIQEDLEDDIPTNDGPSLSKKTK